MEVLQACLAGLLASTAPGAATDASISKDDSPDAAPAASKPVKRIIGPDGKPMSQEELDRLLQSAKVVGNQGPSGTGDKPADVVVTGERRRGSVIGDIPPQKVLNPLDIQTHGASTLSELLESLGPDTRSAKGDGAPIVLINGKRVANFREIANIPPEAIERTEIFPEELALKYGYPPNQKVVNVVTYERHRSQSVQAGLGTATAGGRTDLAGTATHLTIRGDTRLNATAEYHRAEALSQSDRQLLGASDGGLRTLLPETERFSLTASIARPLFEQADGSASARFESNDSLSLLGGSAATAGSPEERVERRARTRLGNLGFAANGMARDWLWSLTGNALRADTRTKLAEVVDGYSQIADSGRSQSTTAGIDMLVSGSLLRLPAGELSASVRGGGGTQRFEGESDSGQEIDLRRDSVQLQGSLDLPIADRSENVLPALGSLSFNVNAGLERLSDFGTLRAYGYGVNWEPIERLSLIASVASEESAPLMQQLGDPLLTLPNSRTFDFRTGETVEVDRLLGGNPLLKASDRLVFSLGVQANPFKKTDLTLSANYMRTRTRNAISPLLAATAEFEAAFPSRFTRDPNGTLTAIDARPINLDRRDQQQFRWGANYSRQIGNGPPGMENAKIRFGSRMTEDEVRRRFPGAIIQTVQAGSALANRFESMLSRFNVSMYHTWRLQDEIRILPGTPTLDLLDGATFGGGGGLAEHEVEFSVGANKRGLGGRLAGKWMGPSDIKGLPGGNDISFDDYTKIDLRVFVDLGVRLGVKKYPWLKNTRLTVGIDNLLDSVPEAIDAAGATPLAYQRDYLDPLGRRLHFSLRKAF